MFRGIIAVVAGYALWTVLWLGLGTALRGMAILPADTGVAIVDTMPLLVLVGGSIVASLAAGYVVALIFGPKDEKSTARVPVLILGVLLLATGVFVQMQYWRLMPIWYHLVFLGLLVPVCTIGSRLRAS